MDNQFLENMDQQDRCSETGGDQLFESEEAPFENEQTFVPEHLREGLLQFINRGQPVGSFLYAVLSNDLMNAVLRADHISIEHIPSIVRWLFQNAPSTCWGSESSVRGWIDQFERRRARQQQGVKND